MAIIIFVNYMMLIAYLFSVVAISNQIRSVILSKHTIVCIDNAEHLRRITLLFKRTMGVMILSLTIHSGLSVAVTYVDMPSLKFSKEIFYYLNAALIGFSLVPLMKISDFFIKEILVKSDTN